MFAFSVGLMFHIISPMMHRSNEIANLDNLPLDVLEFKILRQLPSASCISFSCVCTRFRRISKKHVQGKNQLSPRALSQLLAPVIKSGSLSMLQWMQSLNYLKGIENQNMVLDTAAAGNNLFFYVG